MPLSSLLYVSNVFHLTPIGRDIDSKDFPDEDNEDSDESITLAESRRLALAAAESGTSAGKGSALRTVYRRSKRIAEYVLKRALGKCESCKKYAPFKKKNGSSYLEPHHINRLSDGGLDHPRYIGAICPTCHREIHHGVNGHKKNEKLKAHILSIEPQS